MPSSTTHRQLHSISLLFLTSILIRPSTPTQLITDGQTLPSSGDVFELGFFSPGGSSSRYLAIWYKNLVDQTTVWVANRDAPIASSTGALSLSVDGNLVLSDRTGHVFWSTNTRNATKPAVHLLESGNLVVADDSSGLLLWQSFDYPSNTLLADMKLGTDLGTNLTRRLVSWKGPSDPSPGPYSYEITHYGQPEGVIRNGSAPLRRTGPWNGQGFSGLPPIKSNNFLQLRVVANEEEVYFIFHIVNKSISSIIALNEAGQLQRLVREENQEWKILWTFSTDPCDVYGQCGSFGVCEQSTGVSSCECLPGFEPRSATEWTLADGSSGGCEPRPTLGCGKGDDFTQVTGVKLPDTAYSLTNASMGLDGCREWCLTNCSCLAFAMNGESGCAIWAGDLVDTSQRPEGGGDLYVRLTASQLNSIRRSASKGKKKKLTILMLISLIGIPPLAFFSLLFWKKRAQGIVSDDQYNKISGQTLELPLFDVAAIEIATNKFSDDNILGVGGFGQVYKGKLEDGQEIAVKRLSEDSIQGLDEFKNEVMLIAKLQHRNLVRLFGCCIQGEERMLIYEYMPNKSLDAFIFDETRRALLDWHKRLDIILGIARGLLYLHQDSRLTIIHRDLKASNILLDIELNPKISDFGTARIFKADQGHENTRRVIGTYGYMSPEYAMEGTFSVKSDVFSFGVIILEILSGKKNRVVYDAAPQMNLLGHAWRLWKEEKCFELLDKTLEFSYRQSEILRCIQVGLLCVQEEKDDRPSMSSVVLMLASEDVTLPQPKRPGFCKGRAGLDYDPSSADPHLHTTNEITVTTITGR